MTQRSDTPDEVEEFHRRGEAAWQHYLRTGQSVTIDEVFARIQAMLEARRAALESEDAGRTGRDAAPTR